MKNVRIKGFTLIELIITMLIVALLVTLALPSFRDAVRKSRRSDAMNGILDLHLAQERYRVNNITYGTLADLGRADPEPSSDGHYQLTIPVHTTTNYTILATVLGDQANDSCGNFTLTFTAGVITKTAGGDDDLCWKK